MPEIKWRRPEDIQSGRVTQLLVLSFGRNGSSKYLSCTDVSQKVVLVLRRFPHARMETAFSVEKMDMKLPLKCAAQR